MRSAARLATAWSTALQYVFTISAVAASAESPAAGSVDEFGEVVASEVLEPSPEVRLKRITSVSK